VLSLEILNRLFSSQLNTHKSILNTFLSHSNQTRESNTIFQKVNDDGHPTSNSKFESVRHLALNLARALARNNTASKSMIKSKSKSKSKKKAGRKDNTLLNLELLPPDSTSNVILVQRQAVSMKANL
jgi:hypothetical protein